MGTRITSIAKRQWEVFVNGNATKPLYATEAKAMAFAEKEAQRRISVVVAMNVEGRPPRTIASWRNGDRT